ncbi:MAG TPA: hypothetical protein VI007_02470 [bacterium]
MLRRVIRGAAIAGVAAYAVYELTRTDRMGVHHRVKAGPLPGDDLVDAPHYVDTDAVTIDAPPSAVWSWLVQMGYARAGWYCCTRCNRVDLEPHDEWRVLPQFQTLTAGATLPTHAGGGFRVVSVEPQRALVLYVDDQMAREQAAAYNGNGHKVAATISAGPPDASIPPFALSWSFLLEPLSAQRTRLIARYRLALAASARGHRLLQPVVGLGIFWMQGKQLRGIKLRAEYAQAGRPREAGVGLAA